MIRMIRNFELFGIQEVKITCITVFTYMHLIVVCVRIPRTNLPFASVCYSGNFLNVAENFNQRELGGFALWDSVGYSLKHVSDRQVICLYRASIHHMWPLSNLLTAQIKPAGGNGLASLLWFLEKHKIPAWLFATLFSFALYVDTAVALITILLLLL